MRCPICQSTHTQRLLTIPDVPVHCNVLCDTHDAAVSVPHGDIGLRLCRNCTHLFNDLFDVDKVGYAHGYENSLHFSPHFQTYAEALADELIGRFDLHGKTIVEPGAGQGDFLRLLVTRGGNRGIGFDPSHVPLPQEHPDLRFEQTFLTDQTIDADLIVCRHVLEHVWDSAEFLATMRSHNAPVFFEVPNTAFTLENEAIWDLIYEHCHYFTPQSLATAFTQSGYSVTRVATAFGDQFITIEAAPSDATLDLNIAKRTAQADNYVATFATRFTNKVTHWRDMLTSLSAESRVVIWGAGSKGVTFLNILPTRDKIRFAVDINPRKHGKFVAGSAQKIITPDTLQDVQPDIVIVMNRNYATEIADTLNQLGLSPQIIFA